jgi:hypothetical protein
MLSSIKITQVLPGLIMQWASIKNITNLKCWLLSTEHLGIKEDISNIFVRLECLPWPLNDLTFKCT